MDSPVQSPKKSNPADSIPQSQIPDAFSETCRPWSYRSKYAPTERKLAYERFCHYLEQGGGRTLSNTARAYNISLPVISNCAKKYSWKVRAAAYDEFEALRKAEEERQLRHNEHIEKLETFRNRSEQIGNSLIAASAQLLATANASIAEMRANNETLDRRLIASALNASAKCAEAGRLLTAQSIGADALLAGLSDDGDAEDYS